MNRRSLVVVAVIAAVAVLLALIGGRRSAPDVETGALLVPGLTEALNDVERVVITKAGSETVATLERGADGWTVAEKDGYPADVGKVRQALVALGEAHILEEKTADPVFYDRLGVEAVDAPSGSGTAVAIGAANAEFPTLILGDEANSASRYVRRADEAQSFLIDRNPDVPRETAQWVIADIVDVRSNRVQSVTITHADGEKLAIAKNDAADVNFTVAEIPEGRELSYPGVANVIANALRELKLDDVARATERIGEPDAVTEVRTFDGLTVTIASSTIDGEPWVTFAAAAEPRSSVEAPPTGGEAGASDSGATNGEPVSASADAAGASDAETQPPDPTAEAAAINMRVGGWRYRIPEYQHDQLTRRVDALLKAPG